MREGGDHLFFHTPPERFLNSRSRSLSGNLLKTVPPYTLDYAGSTSITILNSFFPSHIRRTDLAASFSDFLLADLRKKDVSSFPCLFLDVAGPRTSMPLSMALIFPAKVSVIRTFPETVIFRSFE